MKTLEELIRQDEGLSLKVYKDTVGVLTIGYGRNLESVGISQAIADQMMEEDCDRVREEAQAFWWWGAIDEVRQLVVLSMLFQLGLQKFLGFQRMIIALRSRNYPAAAEEMRSSLWARQTPERAEKLAKWMETGVCE